VSPTINNPASLEESSLRLTSGSITFHSHMLRDDADTRIWQGV